MYNYIVSLKIVFVGYLKDGYFTSLDNIDKREKQLHFSIFLISFDNTSLPISL